MAPEHAKDRRVASFVKRDDLELKWHLFVFIQININNDKRMVFVEIHQKHKRIAPKINFIS